MQRLWCIAACLLLSGCGTGEDDAIELAREDMGCDVLAARLVDSSKTSSRYYENWAVEGCGFVRYYRCRVYAVGDDVCSRIGQTELPRPALGSY